MKLKTRDTDQLTSPPCERTGRYADWSNDKDRLLDIFSESTPSFNKIKNLKAKSTKGLMLIKLRQGMWFLILFWPFA
jgi:hypothetical protein